MGAIVSGLALAVAFGSAADAPKMSGFSADSAGKEWVIEQQFRSLVSTDRISKFHRYLTSEPHPAGSPRNNELARWVADQWREQGLEDVTIHEYDVLHSSPRQISLEMVKPSRYIAELREDPYEVDPDTKNPKAGGAYLGYSASGEVTAPVVYAHSGNPEDYDYLRQHGIDVRGKIVLVRYSNPYSYRGFKALTAERLGRLSKRSLGTGKPHSTRRNHLRFYRTRRPTYSRLGIHTRCEANPARRRCLAAENNGRSTLLA